MPIIPKAKPQPILKIPQARVLKALLPKDPTKHWRNWPTYNRVVLARKAGFNPTTGTINRVLNGIPKGSSSGQPHPGLIERGLLAVQTLELDGGATETVYRITADGVAALERFLATNKLPQVRDKESCINDRYQDA